MILALVGFVGAAVGSLAGLGGGIIIVPSLLFLSEKTNLLPALSPQIVVGTSILILIVTGLSSTLAYMKQKKVDYISGMIFFIGSGPGAYVGAIINSRFDPSVFSLIFGALIIFIAIVMSVTKHLKSITLKNGLTRMYIKPTGEELTYKVNPVLAVFICFFIGMLSGLFGIGGGSLLVPVMLLIFGFPLAVAIPTSMFMVFLSAIVGSVAHIRLGNVEWLYALALIPGAWFGGKFGSYLNDILNDKTVLYIFRILLVVVGVRMIVSNIG
nr:sulfite exporter TauE/SafE family protein [Bacillus sp. B15-48]